MNNQVDTTGFAVGLENLVNLLLLDTFLIRFLKALKTFFL